MSKFSSARTYSGKSGLAFPDEVLLEKGSKRSSYRERKSGGMRSFLLILAIVISCSVILIRLIFLQVFQGNYYRTLSDSNRIKTVLIHAPRGTIFDRNNKPLVFNMPGFRENIDGKTRLLSNEDALSQIAKGNKNLEIDSLRQYPYQESASHLLGYIGQISEGSLKDPKFNDYNPGDLIGQMGIEAQYEGNLRGGDGRQLIEVDSLGNQIRKLGQTDPIPGDDIHLTIDIDLQKAVASATEKMKKGAVIVSTPKGEILSLISRPSFDPNLFTLGDSYKVSSLSSYLKLEDVLLDGNNQPLLNRAITGTYPPGSTFKIVVAAAGLHDNLIDENYSVNDTGIIKVGEFSFANWYYTGYGRTEGEVNVVKGLARSNDIFFYKLAEKLGVDRISKVSKEFGNGKPLGIDLIGEASGVVPTPSWKKEVIGEGWYLGDTYHYGIGQGYALTTPLQVNAWAQIIANNGDLYQPHVLAGDDKKINSKIIDSHATELIRKGMIDSCSPTGVAWPLFEFKVKNEKIKIDNKNYLKVASGSSDMRQVVVACKTGTAQHGDEHSLPHSWITLFAPAYKPEVVVTVLSEESGEGSNVAAPIARQILESYFSKFRN